MFLMYVYSSDNHHLTPSVAFLAISYIDTLRGAMGTVPHVINHMVKVSRMHSGSGSGEW